MCVTTWLTLIARWCLMGTTPRGLAVDTCLDAAARARRAERTIEGGVVYVPQALHVSPNAPPMHAQRVARFDYYRTRNCLPPKK